MTLTAYLPGASVPFVSIATAITSTFLGLTVTIVRYFSVSSAGLVLAVMLKLNGLVAAFFDLNLK